MSPAEGGADFWLENEDMSAELRQQFERLEDQRGALLSRVEGLDEAALNRPPAESSTWQ